MKLQSILILGVCVIIAAGCNDRSRSENKIESQNDTLIKTNQVQTAEDSIKGPVMLTKSDPSWHEALKSEKVLSQVQKTGLPSQDIDVPLSKDAAKEKIDLLKKFNDPIKSQELIDGLEKAKNGDLNGAINDFTKALTINSRNYAALYFRSKAYLESGNRNEALEDIQSSLKIFPNQAAGHYLAGRIYFDSKKYKDALSSFNSALELLPGDAKVLNFRGVVEASLGNHAQAIIDYDSSLKSNPDLALTYYNKGTSYAALQKYPEAIVCFTESLKRETNMKLSYMNRGNCYVMLNDPKPAIDDYTKLIELDPGYSDAYYNRGAAYSLAGDSRMCDDWRKAASLGNSKAAAAIKQNCGK